MSDQPQNVFTRDSLREEILPLEVRGIIGSQISNHETAILVWDVSENGIGIWSPEPVKEGALLDLELTTPYSGKFKGKVAWVEDFSNGYRFGLEINSGLTELFILYSKFQTARSELSAVAF